MFSFKNLLNKAASTFAIAKDQVIFEGDTGYLYLDIKEGSDVVRHGVHAPTSASAASYDNTESGLSANTVQDAIDELKGDIPSTFDASAVTSGVFDIARIPQAALERMVTVQDQAARFALTANDVQLGDVVHQTDNDTMYFVVNILALDSGLGYQAFRASVDWSSIQNKPASYTPSSHTHTMSDITDMAVSTSATYTLAAANWSNKTYILSITGLTATQDGIVGISKTANVSQVEAASSAKIRMTGQAAGSITLTADGTTPLIDIPIDVILMKA